MFDDLRRNFLMNPQTGLKIRPFKNALTEGHKDKELKRLTRYLKAISDMDDFTSLDHRNWEKVTTSMVTCPKIQFSGSEPVDKHKNKLKMTQMRSKNESCAIYFLPKLYPELLYM